MFYLGNITKYSEQMNKVFDYLWLFWKLLSGWLLKMQLAYAILRDFLNNPVVELDL